jgi:hypothetical protein
MFANGLFWSAPLAGAWLGAPNKAKMSSLVEVAGLAGAAAAAGAAEVVGAAEVNAEKGSSKGAAAAAGAALAGAGAGVVSPNSPRMSVCNRSSGRWASEYFGGSWQHTYHH